MQEITYASKTFVTTDQIAESLLKLVTAINRDDHAEAIAIPAYTDTGRQVEAKMTLDAGSELVMVPVDLDLDDSFDKSVVESALQDIRNRTSQISRASGVVYADSSDTISDPDVYDI